MHGFYASTIDKHGVWGRLYLSESFFDAVVERFRHRLAWVVARDAPAAARRRAPSTSSRGKRLYGRYWGARVEVPYLHFAVCYYEGIRHCIERGIDVFEPGAGGEHKRARGFVPDADAVVPLARRREDAERHRPLARARAGARDAARRGRATRTYA